VESLSIEDMSLLRHEAEWLFLWHPQIHFRLVMVA